MTNFSSPSVSAPLVYLRLQIARPYGVTPAMILRKTGLSEEIFRDPEARIPIEQENAVWQAIVTATGRPDIGLLIGQRFRLSALGVIGYIMMNAATFGEAARKYCMYQHVIADTYHHTIEEHTDGLTYSVHVRGPWYEQRRFTLDLAVAACPSVLTQLTGTMVEPTRVTFPFTPPAEQRPYAMSFPSAVISFEAPTASITYPHEVARYPILGSNPALREQFEHHAQELLDRVEARSTSTYRVKELLTKQLAGQAPSLEGVADALAISVRSLQRRLWQEGTSFQRLLDEVRRDMAASYLCDPALSKTEVAFMVGFSELSVFSRAFKKWTGLSPSEYQIQFA